MVFREFVYEYQRFHFSFDEIELGTKGNINGYRPVEKKKRFTMIFTSVKVNRALMVYVSSKT